MNQANLKRSEVAGRINRIAGPVVGAIGLEGVCLFDVVQVGKMGLVGEVIRLSGQQATIQVYEDTSGVQVGERIISTELPLVAHLGPGLLGQVYDGLQRPLKILEAKSGHFIQRGVQADPLPPEREWYFSPRACEGDLVYPGDLLGVVPETRVIEHRIMVPHDCSGYVTSIHEATFHRDDVVVTIEGDHARPGQRWEITLEQRWPVRRPRPVLDRLPPDAPLVTGTRVIDALFPVAKGGSAIIPGGFGTGKTVVEHTLSRWADADVVIYVGCGERGNEMTEVLEEFPTLEDPRTGAPLMERTVLIANTSNMPVAAREASVYTGITIAEYYRDMGYDVLMLADSTSRWGEALREISGRLEEMPGEEGYPAYLAATLAEFYERSGRAICMGRAKCIAPADDQDPRIGSVTVVGAVSPPGGDFSEPMTQNSMRVAGTFWALDYDLSRRRHFPAISWGRSYSLYNLQAWFGREVAADWNAMCSEARAVLQREVELLEIVQLVGPDALADNERALLLVARMLREDFLQQSAYHEVDRYCPIEKTYWMLQAILDFHHRLQAALEARITLEQIESLPEISEIARMKELPVEGAVSAIKALMSRVEQSFAGLGVR